MITNDVVSFRLKVTQEFYEKVMEVVDSYSGKLSIPEAIGAIEIVKMEIFDRGTEQQ